MDYAAAPETIIEKNEVFLGRDAWIDAKKVKAAEEKGTGENCFCCYQLQLVNYSKNVQIFWGNINF
jgi:hypothetical protein